MPKVVVTDRFDEKAYENSLIGSQDLQNLLHDGVQVSDGWPSFQDDIFQEHYQPDPQLEPVSKLNKPFHQLAESIRDTEEYRTLHGLTMNDIFNTTIATDMMGREMMPKLSEKLAEEMNKREELSRRKRQVEEATKAVNRRMRRDENDLDRASATGAPEEAALRTAVVDAHVELTDLAQEADDVQTQIDALPDDDLEALIGDLRRAYREAADDIVDMLTYLNGAGDDMGLGSKGMSLEDKKRLATKLTTSEKLQKIFAEAGRIQKIVGEKTANVIPDRREEKVGIKVGRLPIHDVLTEELALAGDPRSRVLFAKKYATESLLMRKWAGKEQLGAGPILILRDGSGSMRGPKEIWAKAITLAFLSLASRDKRDVYVLEFASRGTPPLTWLFAYRTAPATVNWDTLLNCLEMFLGGGTDFEMPLSWAAERIEGAVKLNSHPVDKPWEKADVIMITDGICTISSAWAAKFLEQKQQLAFHTFAVLLGTDDASLKPVIDHMNPVKNLGRGDADFRMDHKDEEGVVANLFMHAKGAH